MQVPDMSDLIVNSSQTLIRILSPSPASPSGIVKTVTKI